MNKMTGNHVGPVLFDYLDGKLSGQRHEQVQQHLNNCPQCRQELKILKSTMELIREQKQSGSNPFFYTRVKSRLESRLERKNFTWRKQWQPVGYGMLLILATWFGVFLGDAGQSGYTETESNVWINVIAEEYNLQSDTENMLETIINPVINE